MEIKLVDCSVDTNVFCHSNNEIVKYYHSSKSFLDFIIENEISVCVDDVFDTNEAKNTSWIGSEYFEHLRFGTYGYAKLLEIIKADKIKQVYKKNAKKHKSAINKLVNDGCDKVFILVTINSKDKIFVTNDFEDFKPGVRKKIKKQFNIVLYTSDEILDSIKD